MKRREVISRSSDIAISQTASSREQGRSQAHRVPEWPKHIAGEATGRDFSDMYARAREERADRLFEELFEIADKPCTNQVEVQQQRNRLDTRKWALSKLAPRKYGDRVEHDVKGGDFQPAILIQVSGGAPEPVEVNGEVIEEE